MNGKLCLRIMRGVRLLRSSVPLEWNVPFCIICHEISESDETFTDDSFLGILFFVETYSAKSKATPSFGLFTTPLGNMNYFPFILLLRLIHAYKMGYEHEQRSLSRAS